MASQQILCLRNENVFQAFARAVKTGALPANAKLFPLSVGVAQPEAPAGYVTVASVLIRPREAFAVGVPVEARTSDPGPASGRVTGHAAIPAVAPRKPDAPVSAAYELPATEKTGPS